MSQLTFQQINQDYVILVDDKDRRIGIEEKLEAHRKGKLHRALSIIIYDSKGRMLIQQRAEKYHSSGLWTETCCSHPMPNESVYAAAHRKLSQEMGFDCELKPLFDFLYKADVNNGLIENEYDHVLMGVSDIKPSLNKEEVNDYRFIYTQELKKDIKKDPQKYAIWFRILINELSNRGLERKDL